MRVKFFSGLVTACLLVLMSQTPAAAQCLVVTPSGSGNKSGSDWGNALAGLPATLVRGYTYFLADGTYSAYTFNTPASGSTPIAVTKATASSHCTDTGWNASTMGSSQAVFAGTPYGNNFLIGSSYLVLDGQFGAGEGAVPYGIKIDDSNNSTQCGSSGASFCRDLAMGYAGPVTGITVQYVEIAGACTYKNLNTNPQACDTFTDSVPEYGIYIAGSSTNINLNHLFVHHVGPDFVQLVGASGVYIGNNFFYVSNSTPINHGQGIEIDGSTNNVTVAFNSFHDCEGTSIIASVNSGTGYTMNSWAIYGNWIWYTLNNYNNRRGVGDGLFGCVNGGNNCANIQIFNNTMANMKGTITAARDGSPTSVGGNNGVLYLSGATGSASVVNNLWYGNAGALTFAPPATWTEDYNSSINGVGTSSLAGPHDVTVASGAGDPFVNGAAGDFRLSGDSGTGLPGGMALSAPYNVDAYNTARGSNGHWDIGAFQYTGSSAVQPNPPASFTVGTVK
jgi:hypothetical protein